MVEDMRATDIGKDNFFLQTFATVNDYTNKANNTGLNLVEANTFRSLNKLQKIDLQTSFAQLYGSATMRDSALAIVNYMMVKDGLQLTYGTLMDAVSPFIMNGYLSHIQTANLALRNGSDVEMKKVFGLTQEELSNEFVDGYLQSNSSNPLLTTFKKQSKGVSTAKESLTVSLIENPAADGLEYARYKSVNPMGFETYTTYKLSAKGETTLMFSKIETYGSNQQNGIGFMFGERPTYKEVRQLVKEKNYGSDTNLDGVYDQSDQTDYNSLQDEQYAAWEDALANDNVEIIVGTSTSIKLDGKDISEIEPKIAAPTRSLEVPEYKINRQLQNQDESIRYASTNGTTITLNPVEGEDGRAKFFDYFTGQEGGVTSRQKQKVLEAVATQGWSIDRITNLLSSNKLINTFLVLHEQDHINNNDISVYWKNGTDLLTQDKIDIEARATIVALLQIDAMQGGTVPAQQTSEVEGLEMEGATQLQLDLQFELEADLTNVNVALDVYWEEQIEPFPEKKAKLREKSLYPFSKMIKAFNEGTYIPTSEMTSEEVFMDEINNCIL